MFFLNNNDIFNNNNNDEFADIAEDNDNDVFFNNNTKFADIVADTTEANKYNRIIPSLKTWLAPDTLLKESSLQKATRVIKPNSQAPKFTTKLDAHDTQGCGNRWNAQNVENRINRVNQPHQALRFNEWKLKSQNR